MKSGRSRASQLSQIQEEEVPTPDASFEEVLEKLPWGWDISFHLNFLPPCYSKEGKDEKYNIQYIKTSFTNKEQLIIQPRYTREELKAKFEDGVDLLNDLEPPPNMKIGILALMAREHASHLSIYKDEKTGESVVGESSYFCVQEKKRTSDVTPFHKTNVLIDFAKKKLKQMDAKQREDKMIELFCSIGIKSSTDTALVPEFESEEYYFPDNGSIAVLKPPSLDADLHNLFSQRTGQLKPPPQEASKVAQAKVRQDMAADSRRFEEYIWILNTREESPYYHSITAEHYPVIKDQWMRRRLPDGQWIYDKFPCTPGQVDTYPSLDELPESIRTKPELFCGQHCESGSHIPGTIMSSYPKYKKTEEERYEEEQAKKNQTLDRILATMAAGRGGGPINCESFTIRFARTPTHFFDIQLSTNDSSTLQSIYDKPTVKEAVRRGYSTEDRIAVQSGKRHIVLEHTNHITGQVYRSIPPIQLSSTTIHQIWRSIPFDNNGFLKGAAFSVQFNIVMRDIPQYGDSSDGEI